MYKFESNCDDNDDKYCRIHPNLEIKIHAFNDNITILRDFVTFAQKYISTENKARL